MPAFRIPPLRCIAFFLAGLVPTGPALAWGALGHRTVAELAERRLSPTARAEVERLLAPAHERRLVDVAIWADELRGSDPERGRQTAREHYVNFHGASCRYVAERDCRDGACVVAAIARNAAVLGDRARPDAERADALRFLVHYVADVHQPLHASYRDDKGGNTVQLRYGREDWNLHGVWDALLLDSTHRRWRGYADLLGRRPWSELAVMGNPANPAVTWAEESCRASRDEGVYPGRPRIDRAWIEARRPIAERRLRQAGARLAVLLNRELDR